MVTGGLKRGVVYPKREPNSISFGGFVGMTATEPEHVVPNDRGMKHWEEKVSKTEVFRPTLRSVKPARNGADPARAQGKKCIPPPNLLGPPRPEQVHTDQWNRRTTEERTMGGHMGNKIRVYDADGGINEVKA